MSLSRHPRSTVDSVARPSGPPRSPVLTGVTILACLAIVLGLFTGITPLKASGPNRDIQLASGGAPSYLPSELWDGGSPDEACSVCTVDSLLGGSGGQSTKPGQPVNPAIGDFTTNNQMFAIQSSGGSLDGTLSYDSEAAESTVAQGGIPGYFGYGWQSTISSAATINGYGQVMIDEPNGAEVQFNPDTNDDGCPTVGQYQDFQKYTVPLSQTPYCATSRLDAQLGYFGGYGYQLEEGNGQVTGYAWTGQLAYSGTRVGLALQNGVGQEATVYNYNVAAGGTDCPSGSGYVCFVELNQASGQFVDARVNGYGLVTEVDDSAGSHWLMGYDSNADLASVTAPGGGVTSYLYSGSNASPYNHELTKLTNPLGGAENIGYYSYGMVSSIQAPLGGTTSYSYLTSDCATVAGCMNETQSTIVTYPDHEIDGDYYQFGVLSGDSFGPATTYGGTGDQVWEFNPSWPANQDGWMQQIVYMPNGQQATIITDAVGNVVTYTDPNGNTTNSMYNDTGGNNLDELCWTAAPGVSVPGNASCTNPPAGSTHYVYDPYGDQLSVTDPLGNSTYSGYYDDGDLCWTAQATVGNGGPCTNIGTSPNGAPTGSTAYEYTDGNVSQKIVAYNTSSAQETQNAYNGESELTYTIPPDGLGSGGFVSNPFETGYTYYAYGEVHQTTAPLGRTTSYTYDAAGDVLTETDPAGVTTKTFDVDGRTCWTLRASSASVAPCVTSGFPAGSTGYTYLADTSATATVTDPNGKMTSFSYSNDQFPTKPTTVTDPMGTAVTYTTYDTLGNACVTGPVSASSCAAVSGDTYSNYNSEDQLMSTVDPTGKTTSYLYTDAAFPMDATSMTNPLSKVTNYSYDADGNQTQITDPVGNTVSTGYDADGRECYSAPTLTTTSCSSLPTGSGVTTFSWTPANQPNQMVDNYGATGQVTSNYSYDADGNLVSSSDDNGRTVGYAYDAAAEVTCIAYPVLAGPNCANAPSGTNSVVDRTFDGAGRLASTTDWLGHTVSFPTYNVNSQLTAINYPSSTGESLSYGYDPAGNLTSAQYAGPVAIGGGGTDSWTYNADEQALTTSQLGAFSTSSSSPNAYNSYKRVVTATNPNAGGTTQPADTYQYLANGSITSDQQGTSTPKSYGYDGGGELCWSASASTTNTGCTSPPSGATTYSYNADGERTGSTSSAASTSYGWNPRGQLCWSAPTVSSASCGSAPSGATSYSYSGSGLRSSSTTGSTTQGYTWDTVTGGTLPLDIDDGTNAYIYGPLLFGGTAPIEQIALSTSAASFLGSTPSGVQTVIGNTTQTSPTSAADKFTYGGGSGSGTISAVGSLASHSGTGVTTLAVTPQAVGDALVLGVKANETGDAITSVSGGGATWAKLTSGDDSTQTRHLEEWLGTVTSTGTSTITATFASSVSSVATELTAQEYTNGTGSSTTWAKDVAGTSPHDTSSTSVPFPSLTPASAAGVQTHAIESGYPTINAVSCPTTSLCAGTDASGNELTSTTPSASGSWHKSSADTVSVTAISCPITTLCVAGDTAGNLLYSTNPGQVGESWTKFNIASSTTTFTDLSCPSATLCVGTDLKGNVYTSTNPTGGSSAWTKTNVDGTENLMSLDCPTTTLCVVSDDNGAVITSTNPTGGASAWHLVTIESGGLALGGVGCASATLCTVWDLSNKVYTSTNPTGGASAWTGGTVTGSDEVSSAACPSSSLCVAVDASGNLITSTNPAGGASTYTVATVDSANSITGITCPSTTLCIAVDDGGNALVDTLSGGSPTPELYVGYGRGVSTTTAGTTSGYTYNFTPTVGSAYISNPAITAATAPTAVQSPSADSFTLGALIKATGSGVSCTTGSASGSGPIVNGVSPCTGPVAGGTSVTISGSNFTGTTAVKFGSLAATSFSVVNSSTITAVAPAGSSGAVDVTVTTGSTNVLEEQAAYSTYGIRTIQAGTNVTPFGFQGSYTDPSGLIYLINRYYDPSTDQFLSVDPAVATTGQPYAFTGDDPLNATDPLGLCVRGFGFFCKSLHKIKTLNVRVAKFIVKSIARSHPNAAFLVRHTSVAVTATAAGGAGPAGMAQFSIGEAGGHPFIAETLGGGGGSPSASVSAGLQVSNASNPRELSGSFAYAGGSVSDEDGNVLGAGGFMGRSANNGSIVGGDFGLGFGAVEGPLGAPYELHGGVSNTWVQQP